MRTHCRNILIRFRFLWSAFPRRIPIICKPIEVYNWYKRKDNYLAFSAGAGFFFVCLRVVGISSRSIRFVAKMLLAQLNYARLPAFQPNAVRQWHRHTRKKRILSSRTYDLLVPDASALRHRRLVVVKTIKHPASAEDGVSVSGILEIIINNRRWLKLFSYFY